MDLSPEAVHVILVEADLPSTIEDLTTPTRQYVVNLLTQFLNKFQIDVSAIRKPTVEQLSTLSLSEDDPEMLELINISEAVVSISGSVFFDDFCLTDITSPVPKRTRKLAKFLVNFLLYTNATTINIENRLECTRLKVQELETLRVKINTMREVKSKMALDNAKKLERKEQLQLEVEQWKAKRESKRAKAAELEAGLKATELEKLKLSQLQGNLKAEAIKMREKTEEIESKIVKSPERYKASLEEVIEQKNQHIEKRQLVQEQMRSKKSAIKKRESYLSIVRQQHTNFPKVTKAQERLTESKNEIEEMRKKVEEVRSDIEKEAMMFAQDNEQASKTDLEKAKEQCGQSLSNLRKEHTELLNEKKFLEKTVEDSKTRQQEILAEIEKVRASTKQREDDTKSFLKNCQELYDAEIKKEREMRNLFEEYGPSE